MFGLEMGLNVESNQRLTVARETRHDEELATQEAAREEARTEGGAEAKEPTPAARQRRLVKLASLMPWIPVKNRKLIPKHLAVRKQR